MEMEVDEQPSGLHDYWGKPVENWYDYFINNLDLAKLLQNPAENKETLGRLTVQFAEQAVQADNESKQLIVKQMPSDDVFFAQSKAACLWLCSMASFAALQWDFQFLLEKHDVQSVRLVMDYVFHMFRDRDLVADPSFGNWLMDKFVLHLDVEYRIPPPSAKQTVNNPAQTADANLIRHEGNRRCIQDLRDRVPTVFQEITTLAVEGKTLYVPGHHCFLDPFIEKGAAAMNIGVLGHVVLVTNPPKPDLTKQCDIICAKDVANRARFDLVKISLCDDLAAAIIHLRKLSGDIGGHPLVVIDPQEATGYFLAMGMSSPFNVEAMQPDTPVDEQMLSNDDHPERRLGIHRQRQETQENGQLQSMVRAENIARDVINGKPPLIRHILDSTTVARFAQAVVRQLPRIRQMDDRRRVMALLHFLCATVAGLAQILKQLGVDSFWVRELGSSIGNIPPAVPAPLVVNALVQHKDPYWTTMVSFDVKEVQDAVAKALPFALPCKLRYPELLSEFVPLRTISELHAVLIGKLNQLGHLRSMTEYQKFLNGVIPVLQNPTNQNALISKALLEAVVVQTYKYNRIGQVSWEVPDVAELTKQQRSVKTVLSEPSNAQHCGNSLSTLRELMTFCLNNGYFDFVMGITWNFDIVTMSRLMAAFGTNTGQLLGDFIKAFYNQIRPFFENKPVTGRRGGAENMATAKKRAEFIEFVRLIKEEALLNFLLSAFAHMFNHALAAEKKPQLKIFVQQAAIFPQDIDFPSLHTEAVEECLTIVIQNAMDYNPVNAFWLRTAADFKYAKNEMEEAASLYMEVLWACDDQLRGPFPDNVVDDTMWSRVRVCLNRFRHHTLAALVCQMMKSRQEEECIKAAEILAAQPTLDAGADYSPMIFHVLLAELLTKVYDNNRQYTSLTKTLKWISKPALNPNNRPELFAREQGRRCTHMLRVIVANIFGTGL